MGTSDENRLILQVQLERVHDKLDKIGSDINDIKLQDAIQNEHLAAHMKRTALLEKRVDPLEKLSTSLKAVLAVITFLVSVPHVERLTRWLLSYFF